MFFVWQGVRVYVFSLPLNHDRNAEWKGKPPRWNLSRVRKAHILKISPESMSRNIAVMWQKSSAAFPSVPTRPLFSYSFLYKTWQQDVAETPLTSPQHKHWALEERVGHHPSSLTKPVLISLRNQDLLCSMAQNFKTKGKLMSVLWTLAEMRANKAGTP